MVCFTMCFFICVCVCRNTLTIEEEVDAFIAEFQPVAAVLCAKPPPPPPPEPESNNTVQTRVHSDQFEFQEFPPSFGAHGTQKPFPFSNMLSRPPPSNQPPPFYSNPNDSLPMFQANIAPPNTPFFAPPPLTPDVNFPISSLTNNQLDFKLDQPPPDFNPDPLPRDIAVDEPLRPTTIPSEFQANNSGSSSPNGSNRFEHGSDKNVSSESTRSNPFAVERKFPLDIAAAEPLTRHIVAPTASPSYINPFSKPPNDTQMFSATQFPTTQHYFQSNAPPVNITSVPPPSGMFQFRAPPNFTAPSPHHPAQTLSPNPPLHSIPPPKPLQLNKIPAPQALDLNAIPEPTLNLDAIKVPADGGSEISRG